MAEKARGRFISVEGGEGAGKSTNIDGVRARLEALGARVANRLERWVVKEAPTGQRFCVVRVQRPGFPKNATRWD